MNDDPKMMDDTMRSVDALYFSLCYMSEETRALDDFCRSYSLSGKSATMSRQLKDIRRTDGAACSVLTLVYPLPNRRQSSPGTLVSPSHLCAIKRLSGVVHVTESF